MKFVAIGKHGPLDPEFGKSIAPRSAEWLRARLADGLLDCAYSLEGGGRLVIANAASADELLAILTAAPDAERDWQITALHDAVATIERYLASLE